MSELASGSLEARLVDLAATLDAPSGEGVAASAVARLRVEGDRAPAAAPRRRPQVRRRLVLAGAALAAVAGGALAVPAVADWLGVRGVEIRRDDRAVPSQTTTSTTPTAGFALDLGRSVAGLAAAEAEAGFAPVVPVALGTPDAV